MDQQTDDPQHALPCSNAGEGIVQPVSKDAEQLSRRLHQYRAWMNGLFIRALRGRMQIRSFVPVSDVVLNFPLQENAEMNVLPPHAAAYIAGLVDADGTVSLVRKHANENRHPVVSISNTDRRLLEFVLKQIGSGKITTKKTVSAKHTPSFTYAIYNRQALNLLQQMAPYLQTYKAKRTQVIIREYLALTPRNGKYPAAVRTRRAEFEDRVLAIKPRRTPCP